MVRFPTLERARWNTVIAALADLGFNAIDLPLVWREHERAPGVFDFTEGVLSLEAMVATVRAAGLRLVVRLGPMATDDAPGLCIPERVLRDRACQARTRRQNPVWVPDPPRVVPLPSIASHAYQHEALQWISAAAAALARLEPTYGPVDRVIVGDGPHALLRDDPYEIDHHPDARGTLAPVDPPHDGPQEQGRNEVQRETNQRIAYLEALVDSAVRHGLSRDRIMVAIAGAATLSPAAHRLADKYGLVLAVPPPVAGSLAIWRLVRHAVALTESRGAHFDVWSGGALHCPPARGSHTVAAARVALAAGARDFTVRMGCAGNRWMGAVLSETGIPRPHAPLWRELLAWTKTLPEGEELTAELVEHLAVVEAARAATVVHPLPLGLLGLLGLTPGQLAAHNTPIEPGLTMAAHESALASAERALIAAAVPVRRVAVRSPSRRAVAMAPDEDPLAFAARAARSLRNVIPTVQPPGAALVRAVRQRGRVHLVVLSQTTETATVSPPGHGWTLKDSPVTEPVSLDPGMALVLTHEQPRRRVRKTSGQDYGASSAEHSTSSTHTTKTPRRKRQ